MTTKPDGWIVVRIVGNSRTIFKVFASWSGGYTQSDSWKLNSGIESLEVTKRAVHIKGYSGSVYECSKKAYGRISPYNRGVLNYFVASQEESGFRVDVFESLDLFLKIWEENK